MSQSAKVYSVAIIGDHFMQPEVFAKALNAAEDNGVEYRLRMLELDWPDTPVVHGYSADAPGGDDGLAGLKEYLGDPAEIADFIGDADVLINHLAPVSATMLDRLPALKFIGVSRGGPVNIDVSACRERGVTLVNTPGRNASAVAEFTVGAIIAETRLITQGHVALAAGRWRGDLYRADRTGAELSDMTVGVVGYGHIGRLLTKLLRPFGCRLLVCDPYVELDAEDRAAGVAAVDLPELLAESDVVTLHARVTAETTQMMNDTSFAAMKTGAYFINTARGPLVDYDALYRALSSGKLRGAFLETFSIEPPPPDWPLLALPNVTLTPHIAGASLTTVRIAARALAEDLRRYARGEALKHLV